MIMIHVYYIPPETFTIKCTDWESAIPTRNTLPTTLRIESSAPFTGEWT